MSATKHVTCLPLLLCLASCQQAPDDGSTRAPGAVEPPPQANIPAANARGDATVMLAAGGYLEDASGRAVYALENNDHGEACGEECEYAWPPVLSTGNVAAPAGLQPRLLGSEARPDGAVQVIYGGHYLYRYAGDAGAESTAGSGVEDKWGTWHLVSSAGTLLAPGQSRGDAP